MKFKIDESYKIRHKILEELFNHQESTDDCESTVGSIELHTKLNLTIQKIHKYHELLKKEDEITCCEDDGVHKMYISEYGRYSYLERKYLKEGRADLWDYYYHPMKVLVPIIAVVVSIVAISFNISQKSTIDNLSKKVEGLEKRTNKIEKSNPTNTGTSNNVSK